MDTNSTPLIMETNITTNSTTNSTTNIPITKEECCICLSPLDVNEKSILTVKCCNQQFHTQCFLNCMNHKKECPLCRNNFNKISTLNPYTYTPTTLPDTIVNFDENQLQSEELIIVRRSQKICCNVFSALGFTLGFTFLVVIINTSFNFGS